MKRILAVFCLVSMTSTAFAQNAVISCKEDLRAGDGPLTTLNLTKGEKAHSLDLEKTVVVHNITGKKTTRTVVTKDLDCSISVNGDELVSVLCQKDENDGDNRQTTLSIAVQEDGQFSVIHRTSDMHSDKVHTVGHRYSCRLDATALK